MKVAVIGGGWAGLTAAVHLYRAGHKVVVFEGARGLGGRARTVYSPKLDATIDNGQHILLGAYTETLALMTELGLSPPARLYRQGFSLQSADGRFALGSSRLPAPLHLLGAILGARGLTLKDRLNLVRINRRLKRQNWVTPPGLTVAQWLAQGRQSDPLIRCFWQPLCLAALNTPVEQACAQLFANVLRDSLGSPKSASDILISNVDLSALWPEHLPREIDIRRGNTVKHLSRSSGRGYGAGDGAGGQIEIDGEKFDSVVIAANAPSTLRLLKGLERCEAGDRYLAMLAAFKYLPIATITLMLDHPWHLPYPMLMLNDAPGKAQFGQWLFDRSVFMQNPAARENSALTIVISDSRTLQGHAHDAIVAGVIAQIQEQTQRFSPMPAVVAHEIIIEKRATFAAVPGLQRPDNATPWPQVWVAGDWTDTGYPAVLEGAVRSGKRTASLINAALA